MTPRDQALQQVVDELANALQAVIGLATLVRRQSHAIASDAIALESAIGQAVTALKRLQPSQPGGER